MKTVRKTQRAELRKRADAFRSQLKRDIIRAQQVGATDLTVDLEYDALIHALRPYLNNLRNNFGMEASFDFLSYEPSRIRISIDWSQTLTSKET